MTLDPKVTNELEADARQHSDEEEIDVVVELKPSSMPGKGTRTERIAQAKSAFEREAAAVRRVIVQAGGEILDSAWINQTLRTRMPKRALGALASDDRVARLDVPRVIAAEG